MQIQVTDGYVTGYAAVGGFPGGIEVTEEFIRTMEPEKIGFYRYEDGAAVLDEEKWEQSRRENDNAMYIPSVQQSVEAVSRMMILQLALQEDDDRIRISGLYSEWSPGHYQTGDVRNSAGQTWECFQEHDNEVYPDIKPGNSSWFTFWRPLHGKSPETARPFVPVQGSHDMYRTGEYMVWTDGNLYRCLSDTSFSPEDYAQAWEKIQEMEE